MSCTNAGRSMSEKGIPFRHYTEKARLDERSGNGAFLAHRANFFADAKEFFLIVFVPHGLDHEFRDAAGFFFFETARRDGRRAESDARRVHLFPDVVRDGILIERNADFIEKGL